jgi:two-component system sensor histidine kinase KdpD
MTMTWSPPRLPTAFVLPGLTAALLVLGAAAAAGRLPGAVEISIAAAMCAAAALVAEPQAVPAAVLVGWMSATSFAGAPYGALRPTSATSARAALAVAGATGAAALAAVLATTIRIPPMRRTLESVSARRRWLALALAAGGLPLLTIGLTAARQHLSLADELLLYLVVVVAVAVIGGFWPAIAAAVAAALLLNWYFTDPLHTFTIAQPDNLLALLLFIVVAVSVSSVVHSAARQARLAAASNSEARSLLQLARTVLTEDSPARVLDLLRATTGADVALMERVGDRWTSIATSGACTGNLQLRLDIDDGLQLVAHGHVGPADRRVIEAGAGLAAASLERGRLRTQAAQAESLAAGNRMRTALLAAVSHDLRTPLASIKASISSLLQTDVDWSPADRTAFLETIAESSDRLEALIANLLDMSRVHAGALEPFLTPVSVDEIAPLALRGLSHPGSVRVDVPEDLPLVLTDGGLLERALANLLDNAVRWSPAGAPPSLTADASGDRVQISVVDHGPGVAAPDRERIFAPFQRLGDQDAGTGVGLGLAVARGFVEAVGGSLVATETPHGGLTMTISLPAAQRSAEPGARTTT